MLSIKTFINRMAFYFIVEKNGEVVHPFKCLATLSCNISMYKMAFVTKNYF